MTHGLYFETFTSETKKKAFVADQSLNVTASASARYERPQDCPWPPMMLPLNAWIKRWYPLQKNKNNKRKTKQNPKTEKIMLKTGEFLSKGEKKHCYFKFYILIYIALMLRWWTEKGLKDSKAKCFCPLFGFISVKQKYCFLNSCWQATEWLLTKRTLQAGECNKNAKPILNGKRWVNFSFLFFFKKRTESWCIFSVDFKKKIWLFFKLEIMSPTFEIKYWKYGCLYGV